MALMTAYPSPSQSAAFSQPDSVSLPAQEIDVDRLVWDREYRDEVQGQLKNREGRLG